MSARCKRQDKGDNPALPNHLSMSGNCPRSFIVAGYLIALTGSFAGIWYLSLWFSCGEACTGSPIQAANLLAGFVVILFFSGYMLVKMLFPVRTGPLLVPH